MNKIHTTLILLLLSGNTIAQKAQQYTGPLSYKPSLDPVLSIGPALSANRVTLWEDDLADANTWTVGYDGSLALNWQIGPGLVNTGGYPTPPVSSPTAANGYAMLDSDGFNNTTGTPEASHMTNVTPFSTLGYPNVVLEFQTFYRKWTNEECYIQISTNNTDWVPLTPTSTDGGPLPNVYEAFPGMAVQEVIMNPTKVRINISEYAGDQAQVWVRFYWSGVWGYSWFVDDVKVIEQPAYEIIMENGFLSSTGDGQEYGRIPAQHLEPTMQVGGEYSNFGINGVTNVGVQMNVVGPNSFNATSTPVDLATAEAAIMDQTVTLPNGGALGDGIYNATFTLTSDQGPQEEDLTNNVYLRNFEVTPSWYSVDGIGNHPTGYQNLGSIGTNSFTNAVDGLIVFNYYPMAVEQIVYGVEIGITANSQAESYFTVSVYDTALVADNLAPELFGTDVIDVTAADIAAGKITVPFPTPQTLQPNGYYVGVTLYSNGGANLLRIVDDLTVPQPGLTSGIQIPAEQVFTNGNAYHIRLATTEIIPGFEEYNTLDGISLYPNPSVDGMITLRSAEVGSLNVEVTNMLGEVVLSIRTSSIATLDLRGNADGVYMVRVSNERGTTVQRVTLH